MFNFDELWQHIKKPSTVEVIEGIGDILQYALPWASLLALALFATDVKQVAWVWVYANLVIQVIVNTVKRLGNFTPLGKRPNGGKNSFPSGHTAGAFSGAAFIHFCFGIEWAVVPYLLAAFTGFSRWLAKKHWVRDVVAGALVSIGSMFYFVA